MCVALGRPSRKDMRSIAVSCHLDQKQPAALSAGCFWIGALRRGNKPQFYWGKKKSFSKNRKNLHGIITTAWLLYLNDCPRNTINSNEFMV